MNDVLPHLASPYKGEECVGAFLMKWLQIIDVRFTQYFPSSLPLLCKEGLGEVDVLGVRETDSHD